MSYLLMNLLKASYCLIEHENKDVRVLYELSQIMTMKYITLDV